MVEYGVPSNATNEYTRVTKNTAIKSIPMTIEVGWVSLVQYDACITNGRNVW